MRTSEFAFPTIETIDDVLPSIEGRPEFSVVKKDGYIAVNYHVISNDTFPDLDGSDDPAIRRECRGLLFYEDGTLAARRFHKFFNVNERLETLASSIPFDDCEILEKLDGSMVSPIRLGCGLRWATKAGITNVSMQAEVFVAQNPGIAMMSERLIDHGWTPVFEWCSRQCRIVVDYPRDRMVLTAIRHNKTGVYADQDYMKAICDRFKVECVRSWSVMGTMEGFLKYVRNLDDLEGFVLRAPSGHMFKIKGDWYIGLHKSKEMINRERHIAKIVLEDNLDDLVPILSDEDKVRVFEYAHALRGAIQNSAIRVSALAQIFINGADGDRKKLAQAVKGHPLSSYFFKIADGRTPEDVISDDIKKSFDSNKMFDKVKARLFPDLSWEGAWGV